jgi:anaerobic magnesium-protoporphyrin IX monomethyl ester cyclase
MSENSLKYMNKAVRATHNRKAHEMLLKSNIDFRSSFMIGYPGETTEDYRLTHDYLVEEFERHIVLSVFSLTDETMPVWDDADKYDIKVTDFDDPDADWSHVGMDVQTARALHQNTFREVRWKNEKAVSVLWQIPYQLPLMPERSLRDNYRVEKLLERLAFAPKDYRHDPDHVKRLSRDILRELEDLGIVISDETDTTDTNQRELMNPMSPVHPIPQHAPV